MKRETVVKLLTDFEQLRKVELERGIEFWLARELQAVLGYDKWENFAKAIRKSITACQNVCHEQKDHFLGVTKALNRYSVDRGA